MKTGIFFFIQSFMLILTNLTLAEEAKTMIPKKPIVVLETNLGAITIALKPEIAPLAVENFVKLAQKDYYNGVIFHRIIKDFMIQGGDPTGTGRGGASVWGKSFDDEISPHVKFDRPGLVAMANAGPKTNGSQFFITTASTPWLNGKHTIFGEVIEGYDIVKKMENSSTDAANKPLTPPKILHIKILEEAPSQAPDV